MSLPQLYAKGFHEQTQFYFAQWMPTKQLALGVVGELVDGYFFRPVTTLKDLGISFDPKADVVPDNDASPIDLMSTKGVSITTKIAGEINAAMPSVPQAKAGLAVEFSKEAAFIMRAKAVFEPYIRDVVALERRILDAYEAKVWKESYAVIYSLLYAPYVDILISESSQSKIEFEAKGDGQIANVELGNVEVQFTLKHQSGKILNFTGAREVTPAFQLIGVKKKLFSDPKAGFIKNVAQPDEALYLDKLGG